MERRALVAVILSMLVLLLWGYYEQKNVKEKQALQKQLEMETEQQEVSAVQPEPQAQSGRVASEKQGEIKSLTDKPYYKNGKTPQVKDVVVETDLATITFTTLGGRLKSYLLKKYKDRDGNRLEMIPKLNYRDMPLSLDLSQKNGKLITTGGEELNANLFNKRVNGAVYEANVDSLSLHERRDNGKLTMS
jgi:YidC/Oxa1 family membrane protein insertase